jgi:hypothetical protein
LTPRRPCTPRGGGGPGGGWLPERLAPMRAALGPFAGDAQRGLRTLAAALHCAEAVVADAAEKVRASLAYRFPRVPLPGAIAGLRPPKHEASCAYSSRCTSCCTLRRQRGPPDDATSAGARRRGDGSRHPTNAGDRYMPCGPWAAAGQHGARRNVAGGSVTPPPAADASVVHVMHCDMRGLHAGVAVSLAEGRLICGRPPQGHAVNRLDSLPHLAALPEAPPPPLPHAGGRH